MSYNIEKEVKIIYYLDYSARAIDGRKIKAAGYPGVIRYIATGRTSKRTTLAEYKSHLAAGLDVWFVCQAGTSDADAGFSRGAELARLAKADADRLGYPSNRVIFFTNDRVELPSPRAWQQFLDGAASVLGKNRIGAYGFGNAMDAAKGHAVAFWQAGRRADVRDHVNLYQDNNTQVTVDGVLCDRNLILKPISEEDDMPTPKEIYEAVWGPVPGAPLIADRLGESSMWPKDMLGSIAERTSRHVRNDFTAQLAGLTAALKEVVASLAAGAGLNADEVAEKVEAAVVKALQEHTVNVDVTVNGDNTPA